MGDFLIMTNTKDSLEQDLTNLQIDDDLKRDIIEYRRLKPLIDLCLNLNHDINNQLAGILGNAEFILTDKAKLTAEQRSGLEQILECGEQIQIRVSKLSETKATLDSDKKRQEITES